MAVRIRRADKTKDIGSIGEAARDFAARIDMPHLHPADGGAFDAAISRVIGLDAVEVLLAESGPRLIGGLGLLIAPFPWNPGLIVAEEIFFWCSTDAPPATALRLLRAGLSLAGERSASQVLMHVMPSSPAKLHQVLGRLGFAPLQASYLKTF